MPQEPDRVGVLLLCTLLGAFIAAVVLGIFSNELNRMSCGLLLAAGIGTVIFAPRLSATQQALSDKSYIPSHWKSVRPLTLILWGSGVAIMGIIQLLGL